MSTQKEEIIVRAGFDNTALASGMRTAGHQIKEWGQEVVSVIAGAFAVEKIAEFSEHIISFAKNISLTAERLGVTTDEVQRLQYAGALTGVQLDTIANALDKIARAKEKVLAGGAGTEELLKSFERFGITLSELQKMAPQELFDKISESVSKTGVNSAVTADAMELIGKSGGKLIPLLKEFHELSEKAPIVSEHDIENIRQMGEAMEGWKMKAEAAAASIFGHLFNSDRWQRAFYGMTSSFGMFEKEYQHFVDLTDAQDKQKSSPEKTGGGGESSGAGASGTGGAGGGSKAGLAALYLRRTQLMREIANVGGLKYSDFQDKAAELHDIEDQLALKNAPHELARLQTERGQVARDLRHQQSLLPIGDAARAADIEKIHGLADKLKSFDDQIADYNKNNLQKIAEHATKQTTAMEKIAGAINGGKMQSEIASK